MFKLGCVAIGSSLVVIVNYYEVQILLSLVPTIGGGCGGDVVYNSCICSLCSCSDIDTAAQQPYCSASAGRWLNHRNIGCYNHFRICHLHINKA